MFVLPSRGRPHNIQRLLRVWPYTQHRVWLRVDEDDPLLPRYQRVKAPRSWTLEVGPRLPLSGIYNEIFARHPDTPWWGFIADDVVPETLNWERPLIEAAGHDGMAVPAGQHEDDPEGAPHFILGGDLPREMGWLALPGLDRIYIDTVWRDIAQARGTFRRVPEVVLKHYHFSNGLAFRDATYRKRNKPADRKLYEAFNAKRNS